MCSSSRPTIRRAWRGPLASSTSSRPGTVQIVAKEGGDAGKATASIAIDGALTDGIRRASSFHYSDVISQFPGESPPITPTFVHIEVGGRCRRGRRSDRSTAADQCGTASLGRWRWHSASRESLAGVDEGRYLLTFDVAWKHGKVSWASEGTLETARLRLPDRDRGMSDAPRATPTQIPDTSAGEPSDVLPGPLRRLDRRQCLTPVVAARARMASSVVGAASGPPAQHPVPTVRHEQGRSAARSMRTVRPHPMAVRTPGPRRGAMRTSHATSGLEGTAARSRSSTRPATTEGPSSTVTPMPRPKSSATTAERPSGSTRKPRSEASSGESARPIGWCRLCTVATGSPDGASSEMARSWAS